jgi:stage II sporulation protein GA (sporulation sigma-E factor processing peptidase)
MTIYLDLLFIFNIYFDFLLLATTCIVLKRKGSFIRLLISSLIGSFSLIFLFVPVSSFVLFLFKIFMGFIMCIMAFKFENIKYSLTNFLYFYMISFILGGFLYYLKLEFSYTHIGMVFINKGINMSYIFLIIISPVIFILYIKECKKIKSNYNLYYDVKIVLKNKEEYMLKGFLDTGNKLIDPITNKSIILIEKGIIKKEEKYFYVPFNSLNNHNLIKCFKPSYIEIENHKFNNYLVAISDKKFNIDGVKCLLNNKLMEELS